MKILVTGGAGFIGSNVVAALRRVQPDADLVVLDDLSTGRKDSLLGLDAELIIGSILDPICLKRAAKDAHSLIHLAARPSVPRSIADPRATHEANATGTLNVLEAARETDAHVVVASSSSVYGANVELPKRESMAPMPLSPYAASKLATESYALAWAHAFGLPTLAFRFFNVYGPGQLAGHAYAAVIPSFIDRLLRDEPLIVHGDGTQTRDFTFVSTVSSLLVDAALNRVSHPSPINLALGTRTSLNQVIAMIGEVAGTTPEVVYGPPRVGDVPHSSADSSLLTRIFPDVRPVELSEGLRRTYDWFLSQR